MSVWVCVTWQSASSMCLAMLRCVWESSSCLAARRTRSYRGLFSRGSRRDSKPPGENDDSVSNTGHR